MERREFLKRLAAGGSAAALSTGLLQCLAGELAENPATIVDSVARAVGFVNDRRWQTFEAGTLRLIDARFDLTGRERAWTFTWHFLAHGHDLKWLSPRGKICRREVVPRRDVRLLLEKFHGAEYTAQIYDGDGQPWEGFENGRLLIWTQAFESV